MRGNCSPRCFKLPTDKLWVTVYAEDDEAYDIWHKDIGVPGERIVRIGDNKGARYASDNFWMMGDTGPCGPCTEIFYDHGPEAFPAARPARPTRTATATSKSGTTCSCSSTATRPASMHPLPKPVVDTGMGLERISAVLQHVHTNYEIDLFQALIAGRGARDEARATWATRRSRSSPTTSAPAPS